MVSYVKKFFVGVLVCASAIGVSAQQMPEELKGKTVTVIVPWGAGGTVDLLTRTLVQRIELQQPDLKMIVTNRPGAGGAVGGRFVADSEPNGLTMGLFTPSDMSLNSLRGVPNAVGYGDISCFHSTVKWGSGLFVHADAPFNNLQQMIEYLKKDTKASYATIAFLTTMFAEHLLDEAGVKNVVAVPYKSAAESLRAVLSKEVTFGITAVAESAPLVKEGKLKLIVVGTPERNALVPNIPSVTETFKNVTMDNSIGYCFPRSTPSKFADYFNKVFDKAAKSPEFVDFLTKRNQTVLGGGIDVANEWYENSWKTWRLRNNKYGHLLKN